MTCSILSAAELKEVLDYHSFVLTQYLGYAETVDFQTVFDQAAKNARRGRRWSPTCRPILRHQQGGWQSAV